ncbi:MAG: tetratricopeptide repeat protein [Azoarcus sp.]|nr:tetratricopeptide repeat protein [Azoarcus sp.]
MPLNWAATQNNLGNVLSILGKRRGDETQLQDSVTAYREALKEYARIHSAPGDLSPNDFARKLRQNV